ncbi:MAG: nitroreductase [Clostridia bacterium]|nr:nitroreductase [Clostridia bacterium]
MDNNILYNMIFKRKSFHIFKDTATISNEEIDLIYKAYKTFTPLDGNIKTEIRIVKESETSCTRGGEYCILMYSEAKGNYLQNIGYLGEQLDLYLASLDIGALWFGIGKVNENVIDNNMQYVIMFNIAKMPKDKFRRDMFKSKRKPLDEVYSGTKYGDIINIARFSPSACNSQPWYVEENENKITIYRYQKPGKRGIMPKDKVIYYNKIDIGIFALILELCFNNAGIEYERQVFEDTSHEEIEKTKFITFTLK